MADLDTKSKKLAKRLASHAAATGESVLGQVEPALASLVGGRPLAERRSFIKAFLRFLERELRARSLVVEHAGLIDEATLATIAQSFGAETSGLTVDHRENADLIGGVRVTLGDNVFDATVAGRLQRLSVATR